MKTILLFVVAFMFSAATVFSQTYEVTVTWDEDECNCSDQGNSYYGVKIVIYDDANNVSVISGKQVNVDFGTYEVDISVLEVNNHYEDQTLQYPPSLEVYAGVSVFCDSYSPPEAICTTGDSHKPNQTCNDFANGISFGPLSFN